MLIVTMSLSNMLISYSNQVTLPPPEKKSNVDLYSKTDLYPTLPMNITWVSCIHFYLRHPTDATERVKDLVPEIFRSSIMC